MTRDLARTSNSEEGETPLRYDRIVAKFGTNVLTAGTDRLDLEVMSALVGQVAHLHKRGADEGRVVGTPARDQLHASRGGQ